jgi:hypothetical protein
MTFIAIALTIILALTVSWAITCGIVYAITLCFGWPFTLATATGIWLIMLLISSAVKSTTKK